MEAAVLEAEPVAIPVAKRNRGAGRPFEKGDPRIATLAKRAQEEAEPAGRVEVEPASNPVLTAFRHVLANPKKFDKPGGLEEDARKLRESNRQNFVSQYEAMERKESASKLEVPVVAPVVVEEDEGVEKALGLIDRVLSEAVGP